MIWRSRWTFCSIADWDWVRTSCWRETFIATRWRYSTTATYSSTSLRSGGSGASWCTKSLNYLCSIQQKAAVPPIFPNCNIPLSSQHSHYSDIIHFYLFLVDYQAKEGDQSFEKVAQRNLCLWPLGKAAPGHWKEAEGHVEQPPTAARSAAQPDGEPGGVYRETGQDHWGAADEGLEDTGEEKAEHQGWDAYFTKLINAHTCRARNGSWRCADPHSSFNCGVKRNRPIKQEMNILNFKSKLISWLF